MANPFDQFDATTAAAPAGGGGNPFDQFDAKAKPTQAQHGALYNALFKEGTGGSAFASADEGILPAARDYALAGLDDLTLGYGVPSALKSATAQAQSNLGPMSYVTGAATYGLGPGKVLGPAGEAIGALSPVAKGAASMAAEGALAGGASGLSHGTGDPFSDVATGVLEGGVLGGATAGLAKGANAGLQKAFGSPGSIDPAAAITATKGTRDTLYGQLQSIPIGANSLKNAYQSATLTPGMAADVSPGFNTLIGRQLEQVDAGGITANDVADFAKNLRAGATSNGDQILAGKISDNLIGALPSEAQSTLQAADAAHQQYMMAQNLAKWQRQVQAGGNLGQQPFTEAERYYTPGTPDYQTVAGLANQGGTDHGIGWMLPHLIAHGLGTVGYSIAGFPGSMAGELAGLALRKPLLNAMKGRRQAAQVSQLQQAYPQMTGQQLTGAQPGPQVGDQIKNLMLGSAY
jgi:hypothetical protein